MGPLFRRQLHLSTSRVGYDKQPGGQQIILKYAGKDITAEHDPIHPPDAIEKNLPTDKQSPSEAPSALRTPTESRISSRAPEPERPSTATVLQWLHQQTEENIENNPLP
ncbi:hypothetical protein BDY19DRAFT_1059723 [Irpex rosettiformis]|uniref:Uncharacterized protein n=1 Tax=Irpex rosettiformis TaxID=378272 RepID=A0ACB8TTG0_9APHY|nr:hypothetical protein BDY19DRAFT_1059723 [Irpex rosettiformis]